MSFIQHVFSINFSLPKIIVGWVLVWMQLLQLWPWAVPHSGSRSSALWILAVYLQSGLQFLDNWELAGQKRRCIIAACKAWLSIASPGLSDSAANSKSAHHAPKWTISLQKQQNFFAQKVMGTGNEDVRTGGLTRLSLFFAGEFLSKCFGNTLETFYCKIPRRGRNCGCAGTWGAVGTGV